jgi:hypothetical protein
MVIGGTETTSNTVEWALAEMLQKRSILRKVQEELDAVVGIDGVVDESHLPQLRYLQLVVKETLRLHPALPLMVPHCPSEDTAVGGYRVPAGSRVFVNVWAIMRDPAAWKDPARFIPERFAASQGSGDGEGEAGGRKVDFTGGDGKGEAYSIAMLLQAFDWELPEGAALDLTEKFGIVMKKATPLVAVPTYAEAFQTRALLHIDHSWSYSILVDPKESSLFCFFPTVAIVYFFCNNSLTVYGTYHRRDLSIHTTPLI